MPLPSGSASSSDPITTMLDPSSGRRSALSDMDPKARALWDIFHHARKEKQAFSRTWDRLWTAFKESPWENIENLPQWKSRPNFNKIRSTIETIVPLITDQNVVPSLRARSEDDRPMMPIIQGVYDYIFEATELKDVNQRVARGAEVFGTWFWQVVYNPDAAGGQGDIEIHDVSPRHIFPAPGYLDVRKMPYFIVARVIDEAELRSRFGEDFDVDKIPPGVQIDSLENIYGAKAVNDPTMKGRADILTRANSDVKNSPMDPRDVQQGPGDREMSLGMARKKYTHLEVWFDSDIRDEEGNKVFPEGRLIDWVNGHIVSDRENPFGFIPYVIYRAMDVPEKLWGEGTAEMILDSQITLNKVIGQILDATALQLNPPLLKDYNATSASMEGKLVNMPGATFNVNPEARFEWMNTPGVAPELFGLSSTVEQMLDTVTGVFDVTQGRRPQNVESAQGIALVQEASQTRIRQKVRNLERGLREVYVMCGKLIKRFFDTERILRITGHNGRDEFLPVNKTVAITDAFEQSVPPQVQAIAQPVEDQGAPFFDFNLGQNFITDEGDVVRPILRGGVTKWLINPIHTADWDISIKTGTSLPVEARIRAEDAFRLFDRAVLDDQALLEELEWPKAREVLERTSEIKELKAALQELTQIVEGQLTGPAGAESPGAGLETNLEGGAELGAVTLPTPGGV